MKSLLAFVFSATFVAMCSAGESDIRNQQIEVGKRYYQNILDNKPEKSYELLSAKDKESFSKEQFSRFINMRTAVLDKNRIVTVKDATVEESDGSMALVKVSAELVSPGSGEVKKLSATQVLLNENGEWRIYSAHSILSALMQTKSVCDSDRPMPAGQKEMACFVFYGTETSPEKTSAEAH
ncbi:MULTISPECIES: hypothetical protein [Thiomicrorhabdus]|uniref:Nuclear transport factor 2 family protein n=1 Tax=Thiomicrorhabdus heinhorstiae TaxID=2748010 RepID=A0ABS0C261_9GAMM|nr:MULTISPECIES: hypothetical protein [Thiomicrorhabdus]MBF6058291.1 hypothetical protein [Thiomicrorhabdus heinhorstiae]